MPEKMTPRPTRQLNQGALELIGDPAELDRNLQQFRRDARLFSSRRARFIERYPKQWVAVCRGKVTARGTTFRSVLAQVASKNIPQQEVMVRFIDRNQRTMIL